jgi:hypothetical protein
MKFLLYSIEKGYLEKYKYDAVIQRVLKQEDYKYKTLYELFEEKPDNYYFTSYKRKAKVYNSKNTDIKINIQKRITDNISKKVESIKIFYNVDSEEYKYLKKYSKNEVIDIERYEDETDDYIKYYIVIKDRRIKQQTIILKNECNICYETNKKTNKKGFFKCSHKEFCLDCYNKLKIIKCPICREFSQQ